QSCPGRPLRCKGCVWLATTRLFFFHDREPVGTVSRRSRFMAASTASLRTADRALPRLVLIGTGGTIAGKGESAVNTSTYDCSVLRVDEILANLPTAACVAHIRTEQLFQIGSENFANDHLLTLGRRVAALLS